MSGNEHFDVIVVGSGAGGGLVAGEVADAGASVLLLETGPHRTAADFTRWEAHANHDIWFAPTLVEPRAEGNAAARGHPRPVRGRDEHRQHEGGAAAV